MNYKQRHSCGFTLVEVITVVIVISIAAGMGAGMYQGTYKKMLVAKAASSVYLMAQYARISAIEQHTTMNMYFNKKKKRVWLGTLSLNANTQDTQKKVVRNSYCRPVEFTGAVGLESVRITKTRAVGNSGEEDRSDVLSFYPDGTADSGAIGIGDSIRHYSIGVCAATARARLIKGKVSGLDTASIDLEAK
jgi:prepilin-type N-terminal cleavage/methylation domain-containing protein